MSTIGRARCALCGARLRESQTRELCDPCQRVGTDPRQALPADFYHRTPIVRLLRTYNFGPFFLAVRRTAGWTQQTLAGVAGMTQSHISAIERGEHRLRDIETVVGLARSLAIPPTLLNFPDIRATVSRREDTKQEEASWVHRRDFTQHVAGLALGIAAAAGLDTARLLALLPRAEPATTRHIGTADIEAIEQLTTAFVRQDFAHGSGPIRDAAVAQLGTVLPLLDAQVPDELRPRLELAAGRLAMQAGWMSFEVLDHDAARRLWLIGLDLARNTDHPLGADLTAYLLYDMALQAIHLNRPDEAVHLTRIGRTASVGSHPVSASTLCCLANIQARAYAAKGDATSCEQELGQADKHFSSIDPATTPPWAGCFEAGHRTGLAAFQGQAHYILALTTRDPHAAGRAVPLLRHAIEHTRPSHARTRALRLTELTAVLAVAGDTDTAVTIGHQAVDAVTTVASLRAYDRLRTLHAVLEPARKSAGVADLRDRLATTAA